MGNISLAVDEANHRVIVTDDGNPFTIYRYESTLEKPVLYPVMSHGGIEVTRGYPLAPREMERVDHPHQVGIWFNFGDVNGFDFWNNSDARPPERKGDYGRIIHREIIQAEESKGIGVLRVKMDWVAPDTDQARLLLEEQTDFIFQSRGKIRIIDRLTRLTAVHEKVVFTDNKEGLMAIRVDRAFEHPAGRPLILTDPSGQPSEKAVLNNEGVTGWYTNSRGMEGPDAWGKRAEWVKLTGTKEGVTCSIVLIDHPENPGYPSCWHARDYGLFSVNNMGAKAFNSELEPFHLELEKGESVTFRHRWVFAPRDLSNREIEDLRTPFTQD